MAEADEHVHATLKPSSDNYRLFPCFEYMFFWGLLITGHYQEALYYLNHAIKNYPGKHDYMDTGFNRTIQLLKGIALVKTDEKVTAEKIFSQLRPSQFYFLSKNEYDPLPVTGPDA